MGKKSAGFAHLHAHSDYSLLDGCARFADDQGKPTAMLEQMASWGFTHQALTDHGNLFGAVEFYEACQSAGITPIIGCELYVATGSMHERKTTGKDDENPQKSGINHLTVLAKDNEGYQNLIELSSKASLEGFYYRPRVDKELLAKHSKGLIALSGCLKGEVAQALESGNMELAHQRAGRLEEIFGRGNFFLEIMDHGLEAQRRVGRGLLELAAKMNAPIVATNDCHYFLKDEAQAHDALLCIGTGKKVTDQVRMRYASQEFYYKSPEEMEKVFGQNPEFLANAVKVANMAGGIKLSFNELHLPDYHVPEGFTQESYLEHLCREGMKKSFPSGAPQSYQERLTYELGVIKKMGFPGYFLIVWDFIHFARRSNVPVGPGRGSGAGSLVSYLLEITSVDPIKYGLLFERFLNPDRRTMPDLDIDFSDEGRELVIEYVKGKYGFTNVAQIITFGTMQSRAVIRDVGRVLDVPLSEVDKIAKSIPHGLGIKQAMETNQEFRSTVEASPSAQRILPLAIKLEGVRRHTGVHAAGTVITKQPVTRYAPMYKNPTSGMVTTGFNDESLVKLGLLKVDFLGLRTLTVIQKTIELVQRHCGIAVDINTIPLDDPKTYELLSRAQTGGVFQLESRGMRDLLIKLNPSKLTDIIALIALFRPGPMKWIDEFCARKHGTSPVRYEHPALEAILKETYGICVYQEQVMEIAKQLAGFTAGEADKLRKAMGKKIPAELNKMEAKFVEGAIKNNAQPGFAKKLYEDLKDFGHYAFNKSHSAAYGIVAYQTAYLKANYPIEFMTALAISEIGRTAMGSEDKENKVATYLDEAKGMGFATLPPSVNFSEEKFSIEDNHIRFGLLAIKNVGEASAEAIVAERKKGGPYKDVEDLFKRVPKELINKKVLESLGKSGALDKCLDGDHAAVKRGQFVQDIDFLTEFYTKQEGDMLFDLGETIGPRPKTKNNDEDILHWEKEVLGMYLSVHPLNRWKKFLAASRLPAVAQVKTMRDETRVQIIGMAGAVKKQISKKTGQAWARMKLEDLTGTIETVLFPRTYAQIPPELLKQGTIIVVSGRVSRSVSNAGNNNEETGADNALAEEILLDDVIPVEQFLNTRVAQLQIALGALEEPSWQKIRGHLEEAPEGSTVVFLTGDKTFNGQAPDLRVEFPRKIKMEKVLWEKLEQASLDENTLLMVAQAPPERERKRFS